MKQNLITLEDFKEKAMLLQDPSFNPQVIEE
jgi:hypothetical protein